jgi:hypothetical protein
MANASLSSAFTIGRRHILIIESSEDIASTITYIRRTITEDLSSNSEQRTIIER